MERADVSTPDEWASVCSESFVPLRVRAVDPEFRASLSHLGLGAQVGFTRVSSEGSEVYRSHRVIAQEPRDDLLLSVHGGGTGRVTQEGRVAPLRRGSAVLYDSSRPYSLLFPAAMSEIVLQVPRSALGVGDESLRQATARTIETNAPLRALTALMASATAPTPGLDIGTDGESIAEAAVCLLRAAVAPAMRRPALVRNHLALRIAMTRFIEEHLSEESLCPELVAHAHHVSLRAAQLVFAEAGSSIAGYIRSRRLASARALLAGGSSVTWAGLSSGFSDAGTFARAFKREYGITPRAVRQSHSDR
jgi:AraC-like DNA-binding protein